MVAKVAINGATRPLVMIKPLMVPKIKPSNNAAPIAKIGSVPEASKVAATAPVKAKVEPTDKSMPRVKITNVMPKAIKALMET